MNTKKMTAYVAGAIVLGAAAWYFLGNSEKKQQIVLATAVADMGNISNSITATGTIEPVTEVTVGTQVSGIINKIYVDYNSIVKKGQVIAEMDRVNLNNNLQSANASYSSAKATFDYQSSLYRRNKNLYDKQLISATEYEQSLFNYQTAQSSLQQAHASLAKAQQDLSYATITSPIDGIVTSKSVEEGQTVASGYSTPTLFTIAADLTKMQVIADVDEADIADIKEGNRVSFTVDAYPNDTFEGVVSQVRLGTASSSSSSSSSTTSSSTTVVTYEVVITADNADLKLKPRLTANVTIATSEKNNVLTVPNKALRFQPVAELMGNKQIIDTDARKKVWIEEGNTIKAVAVETGLSDNSNTEILSGLSKGTKVITESVVSTSGTAQASSSERSPFMPGPRNRNNQNSSSTKK